MEEVYVNVPNKDCVVIRPRQVRRFLYTEAVAKAEYVVSIFCRLLW